MVLLNAKAVLAHSKGRPPLAGVDLSSDLVPLPSGEGGGEP